ncbi:MAG: helix-turn-helix domain-containing protein [Thermodesulfobacteriota bacterium]|nr:helix-turn-helix domain-containing protein [Thermodesulfobacteriota bacterium]
MVVKTLEARRLYNTEQAAAILGIRRQTLYNWRHNRKGPDYVLIGRRPMYEDCALERFIEANRVTLNAA